MNSLILKTRAKTLAAIVMLSSTGFAQALETDTKKELGAVGSIVTGAVVAGPLGAAVGMLTGVLIGENIDKADQINIAENDMQQAIIQIASLEEEINSMEANLAIMQTEAEKLEETLLTRLEFQMMFRTGDDRLSEFDRERVAMLVEYLKRNPELKVRLDGHADHRGTDEYNNLLAKYRAQSVADALIARGIEQARIDTHAHGSSLASSADGDYEGYALDRRVNIEVYNPATNKGIAKIN